MNPDTLPVLPKAKGAKPRRQVRRLRRLVQIGFFLAIAWFTVANSLAEQGLASLPGSGASLHALCPFGGVVSIYGLVDSGALVRKAHPSSLVLAGLGLALAVLVGPAFCGWVCPFGSFQEWWGRLGRRIMGRRYNRLVPAKLDRVLRYLRYLVLAWVLYVTAVSFKLVFQDWDPYFALFQFWSQEVTIQALVILGLVTVASLVVERPFCKYACPYGAVLGLTNLVRVFAIRRQPATCTACQACSQACPMNIEVATKTVVRNHQCISCLECTSDRSCPVADTVVMAAGRWPAVAKRGAA